MLGLLKNIAKRVEGMAAAEFALAAPMMMLMFLGGTEMSRYLIVHQKVEKAAATVSDVIAQSQTLTTNDVNLIMMAAQEVMDPFPFGTNGRVIITSVAQTGTNPPVIRWQVTGGGSLSAASQVGTVVGANANLPVGFTMVDRENVIVAEVYYNFTPMFQTDVLEDQVVYKTAFFKPRLGVLTNPPT